MIAIVLGVAGVLIIAAGVGKELLSRRAARQKQEQREADLSGLAEEFAATAETVLEQVEERTARLERQMQQQMQQLTQTLTEAVVAAAAQRPAPAAAAAPALEPTSPAPSAPASLPPLVQQVASLAGTGLTPQAIAKRLHLSKSEVEVALLLSTQN